MSNKENNPRLGSLFRQVSDNDRWDPAKKGSWEKNLNPNAKAFVPGKNVGGKKKSKKSKKGGKRKQSKKRYKKNSKKNSKKRSKRKNNRKRKKSKKK